MEWFSGSHYSLAGAWRSGTKAANIFPDARADLMVEFDVGDFQFRSTGQYRNLSEWRDSKDLNLTVKTMKNELLTDEEVKEEAGVQNGFSVR